MARQRKLSPERKAFINSLLEHYQPSDANDVQEMFKDLLGDTLQGMLEAEMVEQKATRDLKLSDASSVTKIVAILNTCLI